MAARIGGRLLFLQPTFGVPLAPVVPPSALGGGGDGGGGGNSESPPPHPGALRPPGAEREPAGRTGTHVAFQWALALSLLLASCGSPAPEPVYAPPAYAYLKPLRLNVAAVAIADDWAPGPDDVGALSPVRPLDALRRMAQDRLGAAGSGGRAVFRIEDASVRRSGEFLLGNCAVRLDIENADGSPAGYAEARVARSASVSDEVSRPALYALVTAMMRDMNVEFEFQVRRVLHSWLEETSPAPAALPAPVEQQPLPPPGVQPAPPPSGI